METKKEKEMSKLKEWMNGKKMYITGAAVFICAGINGLKAAGTISWTVPEWVYFIIGSLGIVGVKSAMGKIGK